MIALTVRTAEHATPSYAPCIPADELTLDTRTSPRHPPPFPNEGTLLPRPVAPRPSHSSPSFVDSSSYSPSWSWS